MFILQALITIVTQAFGKILNTAFGWAMVTLFGKVPSNKQTLLSLISSTSILWAMTVIGVVSPRSGLVLVTSRFDEVEQRLQTVILDQDEWNVLYRELLQVKCRLLEFERTACESQSRMSPNNSNTNRKLPNRLVQLLRNRLLAG